MPMRLVKKPAKTTSPRRYGYTASEVACWCCSADAQYNRGHAFYDLCDSNNALNKPMALSTVGESRPPYSYGVSKSLILESINISNFAILQRRLGYRPIPFIVTTQQDTSVGNCVAYYKLPPSPLNVDLT